MRILAVNHLHPDEPRIGGVRVARFAEALAGRGHQVVLLTAPLGEAGPGTDPAGLAEALARHDWSLPFHLVAGPCASPALAAARRGRLPGLLRQPLLAWHYVTEGGVFTDWRRGSRAFWPILAETFRPNIAWATFGNTDALLIAQAVARRSGCPWVMDVKDVWEAFVPTPISALVARRFADAAALTGLSQGHVDFARKRFPIPGTAVYSGIPRDLLPPHPPQVPFRITIGGSTYGWREAMIEGTRLFLDGLPAEERQGIVFTYAGAEHGEVATQAGALDGLCAVDIRPYVPLAELAALQRQAFVNLYGRRLGYRDWFHHKLFELLCADRPIACLPDEVPEAASIARSAGIPIDACAGPTELAAALGRAWGARNAHGAGVRPDTMTGYTWAAQAAILEGVLAGARR